PCAFTRAACRTGLRRFQILSVCRAPPVSAPPARGDEGRSCLAVGILPGAGLRRGVRTATAVRATAAAREAEQHSRLEYDDNDPRDRPERDPLARSPPARSRELHGRRLHRRESLAAGPAAPREGLGALRRGHLDPRPHEELRR